MENHMENRKKLIIVVIVAIIIIFIGIVALFVNKSSQPAIEKRNATTTVDPVSGETITTANGVPVSSPDSTPGRPTYLGFSELVTRGLSISQVNIIQEALTSYSLNNKSLFTIVSLDKKTVQRVASTPETPGVLTFTIVAKNDASYFVSVDDSKLDAVTVKLFSADQSTLLFTQ